MRLIPLLLLVFVSPATGSESPPAAPDTSPRSREAPVQEIKKFGGKVTLDKSGNVMSVNLRGSTKVTDSGLVHLKGLTRLRRLYLGCKGVTDAGLVHLKGMTRLQDLRLGGSKVTDAALVHLKGLSKLQTLHLDRTQISDPGLVHLKGLTGLRLLYLKPVFYS